MATSSILVGTKKALGISPGDESFDNDIVMFINSTLSTLHQIGIGPIEGFSIEDEEAKWDDLLKGDVRFNFVKTYVYLKVRMLFDPPTSGPAMDSTKELITEFENRISILRESLLVGTFEDRNAQVLSDGVLDGGRP